MNKSFSAIWFLLLGCIFIGIYIFSVQSSWDIPNHAQWIVSFMIYYLFFIIARTIVLLGLSFYEFLTSKSLPELESYPLVTIIIPAYNEGKVIAQSIESVKKIDYPNIEILVVDDGSTDDTFEKALSYAKNSNVRVVIQKNGGKSSALNLGISQSLGEYICCMDADSKLGINTLRDAMPYFVQDSNLAAVAGSVRVENAKSLITMFQKLEYIIGLNFHKRAQSALNMVAIVPGPIGVFKKSVLLELGGYESDTFAEDSDLTLKILMAGYNIKYSDKVYALTEAPNNFQQLCIQRYRWSRGMIQAIMKNLKKIKLQKSKRSSLILTYITIETMVIPSVNFLFAMLTIVYALRYGNVDLYGPFFLGLVILDCTIALYSIFTEKQMTSMFFLSIISRITYGFSLEIMRFYSMIDELFNIPMKWGELERTGIETNE